MAMKSSMLSVVLISASFALVQVPAASSSELTSTNTGDITVNATINGIDLTGSTRSSVFTSAIGSAVNKSIIMLSINDELSAPDMTIANSNDGTIASTGTITLDGSKEGNESSFSITACGSCTKISVTPPGD